MKPTKQEILEWLIDAPEEESHKYVADKAYDQGFEIGYAEGYKRGFANGLEAKKKTK